MGGGRNENRVFRPVRACGSAGVAQGNRCIRTGQPGRKRDGRDAAGRRWRAAVSASRQLPLIFPCAVARQDAAPPEAGQYLLHKRCLASGGAASSRAGVDGTRLDSASPRGGRIRLPGSSHPLPSLFFPVHFHSRRRRVSRCIAPRLLLDGNLKPANQRLPMKHHKTKKSGMAMQMIFGTKGQKV